MKVLVTGATGLLGRAIMRDFLAVEEWEILGTCLNRSAPCCERVDLTDPIATAACLDRFSPDIIVHAAAERRPDVSEKNPEMVRLLNIGSCHTIASWAKAHNSLLIYISTDYVFDGTQPPYATDARPNPLNTYGKSKWMGERAVQEASGSHMILRVPILYGPTDRWSESAVTVLAENMRKVAFDSPLRMDDWAVRYPTFTPDVAAVLRQMILKYQADKTFVGIFHWSGDEAFTKFSMAKVMAPYAGHSEDALLAVKTPTPGAPRPQNAHLDCSRLEHAGISARTPFAQGCAEVLQARDCPQLRG